LQRHIRILTEPSRRVVASEARRKDQTMTVAEFSLLSLYASYSILLFARRRHLAEATLPRRQPDRSAVRHSAGR
jgi:hypothetical protein